MKIVIVGCGRVGALLASLMTKDHHEVTIIDQNSEAFERLGQEFKGRIKTVVGDGIDEDVLRRAGLDEADAFASVTNGDNRNIMAAQIAKYRFHVPRVICRIYDPIRTETYRGLGLDSISPTVVGAKLLRDELLKSPDAKQASEPTASGRETSAAGRPQPS
jgi:trk/ktr system potassium uptake protein